MEIDITDFFNDAEPWDFSASRAELGDDAGPITWRNAMIEADRSPLLTTPEQLDALRDNMRGYGAWEGEVIDAWTARECNAMFIQEVSAQMREMELCMNDDGETDWKKYETLSEEGTLRGDLYRGSDGRIYFYLGE